MSKRGERKRKRTSRPAREREERKQDPRLAAARVTAMGGQPVPPGTWVVVVSQVRMDDGRMLNWHPPQPVAFSLCEAKRLTDRAVPRRLRMMGNLRGRENDSYVPQNSMAVLDVVSDLWSAVLHAFAAVEAIASDSIDHLPDDAVVTIGRKDRTEEVSKANLVRRLNLDEKLSLAVPMLNGGEKIKGTRPWERYLHLKGGAR